jgi:hypothetical protein
MTSCYSIHIIVITKNYKFVWPPLDSRLWRLDILDIFWISLWETSLFGPSYNDNMSLHPVFLDHVFSVFLPILLKYSL